MTDTQTTETPTAPKTQVTLSLDSLQEMGDQIKALDTQIAAATGSDAETRKAIVNEILSARKEDLDTLFEQIVGQITKFEPDILVGVVARLDDALKGDLKTASDTVVDEKLKAQASTGEQVDVATLKENRKARVTLFQSMKQILGGLGVDVSGVEDPKRAGGRTPGSGSGKPKSGKNKENVRYLMDGKGRPRSQNTFSSLAFYATEGLFMTDTNGSPDVASLQVLEGEAAKDKRLGAPQLKALLAANGITFGENMNFEFQLPNGKKIGARPVNEQDMVELGYNEDQPAEAEGGGNTPDEPGDAPSQGEQAPEGVSA